MSSDRVAVEVTRLAFPLVARKPRSLMLDPVVRAGLLVDLVLAGSLVDVGSGVEVDTTPTGFVPADRLLAAVVDGPSKSLQWWLYHAPVGTTEVADTLIGDGTWDRPGVRRRYRDLQPQQRSLDLSALVRAVAHDVCTPTQAMTALLLDLLPLGKAYDFAFADDELPNCGAAHWLLPDLLRSLRWRAATLADAATQANIGLSGTII